jgi:nitric oxide reductase subunit C
LLVLGLAVSGCGSASSAAATPLPTETEVTVESTPEIPTATPAASTSVTPSATLSESTPVSDEVTTEVTTTIDASTTTKVSTTEVAAPEVADPAVLAAGLSVYRAQYCGVCHTLDAAETRGTFGPPHNGMGALAAGHIQQADYQGGATTAEEYIRESIVEPQVYIVPGYATTSHRMPSYAHLDATALDALVAFLLAQ